MPYSFIILSEGNSDVTGFFQESSQEYGPLGWALLKSTLPLLPISKPLDDKDIFGNGAWLNIEGVLFKSRKLV